MDALATILRILLPAVYALLALYFARTFFRSGRQSEWLKYAVPAAYTTLALHAVYIGAYTAMYHHDLVATVFELCSLIAFTLLAVYVFAELRSSKETSGTGFFVAVVCFVLQLVSSVANSGAAVPETKTILKDPIFNLHVTTSVFGYAALMLAAIYGGLYLLLFRAIRGNHFGAIFQHIPSLAMIGTLWTSCHGVWIYFPDAFHRVFGVILFSRISVEVTTSQFLLDPKVVTTVVVWLVFGATLLVRRVMHLEGRRLVLFWMSGFILTLVSMTVVNWIGTAFHSFL